MKKLEKEIYDLEKQIEEFEEKKSGLISELEKRKSYLKELETQIITEKREKFLIKLKEFEKEPTDEQMEKLLADLTQIKFSEIESYESQFKLVKKLQSLFKYIYAKQDVELVEKYLLAKVSLDSKDISLYEKDIEKYKKHFEKDGYTDTESSQYHMGAYCIFSYEIQELMFLLGKLDYHKKPKDCKDIYRSEQFEKYMLRAIVGVYGYWEEYIYADGKFGHEDYERREFERLHDMAYQKEKDYLTSTEHTVDVI